jgi:DNA polymerase III subunit gamma/tau
MENFVVSARKYRPVLFDSVVGQSHITTTLQNAIKTNHLAQAFLFCGPRGVGKTTCARILAKTINCQNLGDDTEACNECDSCKSFAANASFNIHELDAASNNSVEDIRNLIDQIRFPPQQGKYKIYIIDEVHMLSTAAFNAFLKTLEEPPSYAIFILATTEKHKILPTILSRCQIFDFNRIQNKDISSHLVKIAQNEGIEVEIDALDLIALKADGGLRDALSMFDLNVTFASGKRVTYAEVLDNLHVLDYDYYFKIVDYLFNSNLSQALLLFSEILHKGFDGHQFVIGLNEHYRNLMVSKDPITISLMEVSEAVQQKFLEQSKLLPLHYIYSALSIGSQLDLNYKAAKAQKLHVEIGLMKISQLQNLFQLNQLPNVEVEKKNDNVVQTAPKVEILAQQPMVQSPEAVYETEPVKKLGRAMPSKMATSDFEVVETVIKPKEAIIEKEEAILAENKPINAGKLYGFWAEFIGLRDMMVEKVMLDRQYVFENNTIYLELDNDVQMQQFDILKLELMGFLRKRLHNSLLSIEVKLMEKEAKERMPYTAQEKFDYLVTKNPILNTLREKLQLDLSH